MPYPRYVCTSVEFFNENLIAQLILLILDFFLKKIKSEPKGTMAS